MDNENRSSTAQVLCKWFLNRALSNERNYNKARWRRSILPGIVSKAKATSIYHNHTEEERRQRFRRREDIIHFIPFWSFAVKL